MDCSLETRSEMGRVNLTVPAEGRAAEGRALRLEG